MIFFLLPSRCLLSDLDGACTSTRFAPAGILGEAASATTFYERSRSQERARVGDGESDIVQKLKTVR